MPDKSAFRTIGIMDGLGRRAGVIETWGDDDGRVNIRVVMG